MLKNEKISLEFLKDKKGYSLFSDGASNSTHLCSGIGVAVFENDSLKDFISKRIHHTKIEKIPTNNEAEYSAIIHALKYCKEHNINAPVIYTDSKLVVNQLNGEWMIKKEHLVPLYLTALEIKDEIEGVKILHVRREYNYFADFYSKHCIGQASNRESEKFKNNYLI